MRFEPKGRSRVSRTSTVSSVSPEFLAVDVSPSEIGEGSSSSDFSCRCSAMASTSTVSPNRGAVSMIPFQRDANRESEKQAGSSRGSTASGGKKTDPEESLISIRGPRSFPRSSPSETSSLFCSVDSSFGDGVFFRGLSTSIFSIVGSFLSAPFSTANGSALLGGKTLTTVPSPSGHLTLSPGTIHPVQTFLFGICFVLSQGWKLNPPTPPTPPDVSEEGLASDS
mmetsp:Transcript_18452/g.38129  ORF Transcript_18452/g.38129 Transcript_18452/m.38129 type:complete len:225 (-) Transcript_18452:1454-2128(-)